jgi:hypothetical protein
MRIESVVVAMAIGAVGCGTSGAPAAATGYGAAPATAPAYGGATASAVGDAPASHASVEAPRPAERPGLATRWGEWRESHVREVRFERADEERPFATAAIFYDDREGVEALSAYHGDVPHALTVEASGGAITIAILDAAGEPLDAVRAGDRTYVTGREGERYTIAIANRTPQRVEAVATVDGLDVLTGAPGSVTSRGYLIAPWRDLRIEGFRRTADGVAAFRFSSVRDSYAAAMGSARNVGVIGVAFFDERHARTEDELIERDTASPFPSDPRFAPPPRN